MEFPRRVRTTAGRLGGLGGLGGRLLVAGLVAGVAAISLALAVFGRDANGQDAAPALDDGIAAGTVAFFAGSSCPPGWSCPDYAKGRMMVAVTDGSQVGVTVGTALADREDRMHQHDYSVSVTLAGRPLLGSSGGSIPGAQAQTYPVAGQSDPAPSGLPFVQLLACERQ